MRRNTFILILSFIFLTGRSLAQKDVSARLLYYVDDSNNAEYIVPFIESYLKDLSYPYRNPVPVYSQVMSLNMLFEKRKIEGKVIDAFIYTNGRKTTLVNSEERNKQNAEISNFLLNYDRFLLIKVMPFNSLLEYQFLMYNVIKRKTPGVKDIPVLETYRSSSVFINPTSPSCKDDIAFTLKQVCAEINESPTAQISINSKIPKSGSDTIFAKVGDTLNISALATDSDSPKELLTYSWSASDEILYKQILQGKPSQKLVIDTSSVFNIGLTISDGISKSKKTNVTVKVIYSPAIDLGNDGNVTFLDDLPDDIFSHDLNEIRDDIKQDQNLECKFLFLKNIWGNRLILAGEDSLTIYFSKGILRVMKSDAPDSILKTTVKINKISACDTSDYLKSSYINGYSALIRFYPEKKFHSHSYYYTFYADEQGVASRNLNLRVSFIKVSQFSIFNEYTYTWLGSRKGSLGNAILGIGWRPFGFMQINYGASHLFASSANVNKREGDQIITGNLNSRLVIEFMNPKGYNINCVSVQMQQFDIDTKQGKRKDYIWGMGVRTTIPFEILGSKINPIGGFHYFPNLRKVSYISDAGMFETYLGIRVNFFAKK